MISDFFNNIFKRNTFTRNALNKNIVKHKVDPHYERFFFFFFCSLILPSVTIKGDHVLLHDWLLGNHNSDFERQWEVDTWQEDSKEKLQTIAREQGFRQREREVRLEMWGEWDILGWGVLLEGGEQMGFLMGDFSDKRGLFCWVGEKHRERYFSRVGLTDILEKQAEETEF